MAEIHQPSQDGNDPETIRKYDGARALFLSGDTDGAIAQLRELADAGIPDAQYTLGNIYLHATDRKQDPAAALECFLAAAAADFAPAFGGLGDLYYAGVGVEKSVEKAVGYYGEGARRQDLASLEFLADFLTNGKHCKPNHQLALPAFYDAARLGSAFALRRLGLYYSEGAEVEQDLKRASELLQASAEMGDEYAAYNLAQMYEAGNSAVAMDIGKAIQLFMVAAEKDVKPAFHNIGACYARPDFPKRDLSLAAHWFHKGAEKGLKLSMESLARIYASGEGVELDPDKAAYWRRRAAEAVE